MKPSDQPASKADLYELEERLSAEFTGKLTSEIADVRSEIRGLRTEMDAKFDRVYLEIGASAERTANVVIEHIRHEFRSYDDRYRDLPARVARLEKHTGLTGE